MFNPSAYPFVRILAAFAAGIILQDTFLSGFDPTLLFYACLPVCAISALFIHRKLELVWVSGLVILGSIVIIGMKAAHQHHEIESKANHFSKSEPFVAVTGIVADLPEIKSGKTKFRLQVQAVTNTALQPQVASGNLQVYLQLDSTTQLPEYGDQLLLRCSPMRIPPALNPDAFDFAAYMHTQNVHYQAFVRADSLLLLDKEQGSWIWSATFQARSRVLGILAKHFDKAEELGVAEALLVGYKGHLPDELQNAYIETGSMHILAVSGAHVGIIFIGVMFLLKRVHIRTKHWRWMETAILLAAIWGFAFLAGMGPSIARATVMFSFFLLARLFRLDYEGYNVMAAAAFCILLWDPFMLFQVSFQLSFLAVLGMMLFYPILYKLSPLMPAWLDYLWKIFLLGLAAQLGTLPLSLLYFHQFPVYFWLSGLIVVPVASLYMYGAAALLVAELVVPALGTYIALPIIWMVKLMNMTIYLIQKLPGALLDGIWLRPWEVVIMAVGICFLALQLAQPKGKQLVGISACFCLLGASHLTKTIQRHQQEGFVVYHTGSSKTLLIDAIQGHTRFSLGQGGQVVTERFAAKMHRMATGQDLVPLPPDSTQTVRYTDAIAYQPPFIQAADATFALIQERLPLRPNGQKIKVDVLIIDGKNLNEPETTLSVFEPKTVVLSQNVPRKSIAKWVEKGDSLSYEVHSIQRNGAWQWKE